jgi:hypothetical protein
LLILAVLGPGNHDVRRFGEHVPTKLRLAPWTCSPLSAGAHDGPDRYAEVVHGTLDDVCPKVLALNTSARGVGVFVTNRRASGHIHSVTYYRSVWWLISILSTLALFSWVVAKIRGHKVNVHVVHDVRRREALG